MIFACPETTWRPTAPESGGLSKKILKLGKIYHIRMILSQITYPPSPKIKPIHEVYANVSELPPPPYYKAVYLVYSFIINFCYNYPGKNSGRKGTMVIKLIYNPLFLLILTTYKGHIKIWSGGGGGRLSIVLSLYPCEVTGKIN